MVRSFEIVETVPISYQICCDILFKQPDLKRTFHTKRGDFDVVVSDWIEQRDASLKRVCFYTMVENADSAEPILTRCLESQTLSIRRTPNGSTDEMLVSCSITPENSMMGNIFRIEAHWTITPITVTLPNADGGGTTNTIDTIYTIDTSKLTSPNDSVIGIHGNDSNVGSATTASFCTIIARGEVECTKRIWGLQGMAEKVLYQQALTSLQDYLVLGKQKAFEHVERLKQEQMIQRVNSEPTTPRLGGTIATQLRMRSLGSNLRTVVSGTGKLVRMLSNATGLANQTEELLDEGLIAPMTRSPGSTMRGSSSTGSVPLLHTSSSLASDCLVTMMTPAHAVVNGSSTSMIVSEQSCCGVRQAILVLMFLLSLLYVVWQFVL